LGRWRNRQTQKFQKLPSLKRLAGSTPALPTMFSKTKALAQIIQCPGPNYFHLELTCACGCRIPYFLSYGVIPTNSYKLYGPNLLTNPEWRKALRCTFCFHPDDSLKSFACPFNCGFLVTREECLSTKENVSQD
jgi:hypothetical protein